MPRSMITGLLAIVLLSSSAAPTRAQDEPVSGDAKYKSPPWHLVDTWWDTGRDVEFESYSVAVTISDDIPSSARLYIAPIGLGHLSGTQFYGGIQTQVDGNTRADRHLRKLGTGFLFSMWGERSVDAIRPSLGGFFQSSGHEGDFVSVRRPYEWARGQYTYKLVRMDKEEVEGKPYTWVGAFVYSHAKDENVFVGALRFPGERLILSRRLASFVEVYGSRRPVDEIPQVTITFGDLRLNGKRVEAPAAYAVYPKDIPDYADARAEGNALVITVGKPVVGRTQRRVTLLGK